LVTGKNLFAPAPRPFLSRPNQPIDQYARGEKSADQLEDALVGHRFGHQPHQVVIDSIDRLPRTPAGFTTGSCPSGRGFAPRFF
jgi:hypothetical protein